MEKETLARYSAELRQELEQILEFWINFTVDEENGGFIGRISSDNVADFHAPKGAVLNARILWSFSAAFNQTGEQKYLDMANRAYHYLSSFFLDRTYGGVYWSVDAKGNPLDTKKQVYAVAFSIYALSEYHLSSGLQQAKEDAVGLYEDLIRYSYDVRCGGYFEAFSRDWTVIADLRLSDKDMNEQKTMNTHLHVLEAFSGLYKIWPDELLKKKIAGLTDDFLNHIINNRTGHLALFFDENWTQKSDVVSFGHDIEASWLLLEAAEAIQDEPLITQTKAASLKMAVASLSGLDRDGGMWYEREGDGSLIQEKHWWVQAEAMVGFYNAWQLSGDPEFLEASIGCWSFIKKHIIDRNYGEWFWGITSDYAVMPAQDKAGIWKCPYHNSRACMELIRRIGVL